MTGPTTERPPRIDARTLARSAALLTLTMKAEDVVILDLSALSAVCDYFVICHGDSEVQVRAILDAVDTGLEKEGVPAWHVEGREGRSWVLLDYVDVVVHIFRRDAREYYRLEDLWADAPREEVREPGEVPASAPGGEPDGNGPPESGGA